MSSERETKIEDNVVDNVQHTETLETSHEIGTDEELLHKNIEKEKQEEERIRTIATMDSSVTAKTIEEETSSFLDMPPVYLNIDTKSFGNSRSNPFFEIKKRVLDSKNTFEDRTQGLRYMQRIPHIKRSPNCIECALSILNDDQYPIRDRYVFFANNDKYVKLDYDIVNACHKYFFNNFDTKFKTPLEYKILSAQYLLTQHCENQNDIDEVQNFLIELSIDKDSQINYRAECADILSRAGYGDVREVGHQVIRELGSLYEVNKRTTIYSNLENVHDSTITEQLLNSLKSLITSVTTTKNAGDIYDRLAELTKHDERADTILKSFQRIVIDTAKYENLNVCDIMCLVWQKIITSSSKHELEKRFVEELYEMYNTCSSGHLSRLLNILSGFFEDITPVKISYNQQLRSNVFARLSFYMKSLSQDIQDQLVKEMTSEDKSTIEEFIISYDPKDELQKEFKEYIDKNEFDNCYKKALNDFFGIEEKLSIIKEEDAESSKYKLEE